MYRWYIMVVCEKNYELFWILLPGIDQSPEVIFDARFLLRSGGHRNALLVLKNHFIAYVWFCIKITSCYCTFVLWGTRAMKFVRNDWVDNRIWLGREKVLAQNFKSHNFENKLSIIWQKILFKTFFSLDPLSKWSPKVTGLVQDT